MSTEADMLNNLLWYEAQTDKRIVKLGYKIATKKDCGDSNLFNDFHDGILYNVIVEKKSLSDARYFAKHGELPEKSKTDPKPAPKTKTGDSGNKGKSKAGGNGSANKTQPNHGSVKPGKVDPNFALYIM